MTYTNVGKNRGGKKNTLLHQLALTCCRKGDPSCKRLTQCAGMKPKKPGEAGCDKTWAWASGPSGRDRLRILDHASSCDYLPIQLKEQVAEDLVSGVPSEKLKVIKAKAASKEAREER